MDQAAPACAARAERERAAAALQRTGRPGKGNVPTGNTTGPHCRIMPAKAGGYQCARNLQAGLAARAKVQRQGALSEDPDPGWAKDLAETVAAGMAGPVFQASRPSEGGMSVGSAGMLWWPT
jgi:hypothetical protein